MDSVTYETAKQQKHKAIVVVVGITAALAGLLFGMDTGVISGALGLIDKEFHLNEIQEGWVVSSVLLGAVIGTLLALPVSRMFGRRNAILLSCIIFFAFSLASAMAASVYNLIVYRVFLGMGLGLASYTAPLYLSEVAPKRIRGSLIALYQLMITIGLLAAFISDTFFAEIHSWRWMLGVITIPAFFMFFAVLALPKSPRWLVLVGQKNHARTVLKLLRHRAEIDPELNEIEDSVKKTGSFKDLLSHKNFLKVIALGMMLQIIQQLSGINTAMYYAPTIFKLAGFASLHDQLMGSIAIGLTNVITTIIAIMFIDRFGRRPIMMLSAAIMICSFATLAWCYHLGVHTDVQQYTAAIAVLVFIFGFAIGFGPVVWILCAEIFPIKGRDAGVTLTTTANWTFNWLVSFSFLIVIKHFGASGTFTVFTVLLVLSFIFVMCFVPETKGVSLEQIEANVLDNKRLKDIGR